MHTMPSVTGYGTSVLQTLLDKMVGNTVKI